MQTYDTLYMNQTFGAAVVVAINTIEVNKSKFTELEYETYNGSIK